MLLQVQSMTDAVRLRRLLKRKNISAEVMQTPGGMRNGGCSFSVRISQHSLSEAERSAREAGIRILSVSGSDSG